MKIPIEIKNGTIHKLNKKWKCNKNIKENGVVSSSTVQNKNEEKSEEKVNDTKAC